MSKLNFNITGDIQEIRFAVKKILEYINNNCKNISDNTEFDIKVIINEILTNSIKHFSKDNDVKNTINIIAGISQRSQLYLVIKDNGNGYNSSLELSNCDEIDYNMETIKECGRGLLIIKNLCECVKFNKAGNKIVILKNLNL